MLNSDDLAFFAVLAGASSLADGARHLNVTPPAVTQRLKALEARLGVRLIERGAKGISLTDEGALVLERARDVAQALDTLTEDLARRSQRVTGHLRIAAPYGFGRDHVAPAVASFATMHPHLTITLDLSDAPAARLLDRCDIVIHIGESSRARDHVVTTLAPNRRILCAAPAYLAQAPALTAPGDLAAHRCLALRENDEDVTLWRFRRDAPAVIRIHPALSSNDGAVIRDWALQGQGIMLRSEWHVAGDLAAGRLVALLPEWDTPDADVTALLGRRHGRSARTTAFLAHLRQAFSPPPWRQISAPA